MKTLSASTTKPIKISMVQDCTATATKDVDVRAVLAAIKDGKWRKQIEKIREVYRNGSGDGRKAIDPLKKKLPAVTFSGRFKQRANGGLIQHSGLICADLDSLGDKLPDVRAALIALSKHLYAIFVSPSG